MGPTKLGRYEILKPLAQGGMAEVLLARATGIEGFERHVVIKRIRAEQARNTQFVKMFLDEARLAAALHHQNIVQVHDIGQEDGEYFFTMEYVHGEDVRTLLRQASSKRALMPIGHAITIAAAAAAGLHHAHEQRGLGGKPLGIVHRDVSPANILVGFDGGVKVVDFGIAKAAMRSAETASGTIKGKVAYMSPEQCTGQPVDRRADVFALGIVLDELVTVRRLFKADSDFLMMTAIVAGDVPPPSRLRPDLPPELEEIILKALSVDPDARFQTADELRLALEQFAKIDFSPTAGVGDPGCASPSDTSEKGSDVCDNGIDNDNDNDGLVGFKLTGGDPAAPRRRTPASAAARTSATTASTTTTTASSTSGSTAPATRAARPSWTPTSTARPARAARTATTASTTMPTASSISPTRRARDRRGTTRPRRAPVPVGDVRRHAELRRWCGWHRGHRRMHGRAERRARQDRHLVSVSRRPTVPA